MGSVQVEDSGREDNFAHLLRLYVSEQHRRKKIGSTLVKACEDWAREKGYKGMRLGINTVKDAPEPQKQHLFAMYKGLGYTERVVMNTSDVLPKLAEIEVAPTIVTVMAKTLLSEG